MKICFKAHPLELVKLALCRGMSGFNGMRLRRYAGALLR